MCNAAISSCHGWVNLHFSLTTDATVTVSTGAVAVTVSLISDAVAAGAAVTTGAVAGNSGLTCSAVGVRQEVERRSMQKGKAPAVPPRPMGVFVFHHFTSQRSFYHRRNSHISYRIRSFVNYSIGGLL